MKQLKVMVVVFAALLLATIAAKIYFDRLADDLGGPETAEPPSEIHPEEPETPGTEEEGLIIEVE